MSVFICCCFGELFTRAKRDDCTYTIFDSSAKERPEQTEDFELIETKDTTEKIVGLVKPITLIDMHK